MTTNILRTAIWLARGCLQLKNKPQRRQVNPANLRAGSGPNFIRTMVARMVFLPDMPLVHLGWELDDV
jgi:hypothetical protein